MLFEHTLRRLINHLLIEAKADVLQARYPHIDVHALAVLDPSPTKKYLEWMIKIADKDKILDMEELGSVIQQFDSAVQRLSGQQRDINSYKSLRDLQNVLNNIGSTSKTRQKKSSRASGSQHVGSIEDWDVYFITSHEAAMLLGKGTKWCITEEDSHNWNNYIQRFKFFYALRKVPQGDPLDKIAYACHLNSDKMEVFNAIDEVLQPDDAKYTYNLTGLIFDLRNSPQYDNYVATGKNIRVTVVNNIAEIYVIQEDGSQEWFNDEGQYHRKDGPAFISADGSKRWYLNGLVHREGGPAVELIDGTKKWLLNGKYHREVGPAIERGNGDKEWWLKGKRHRIDGPAIEYNSGSKEWWINGIFHREDGPAIEKADGSKAWWINGKRHREDGPAIEWANGDKEWWLNGKQHREDGPAEIRADGTRKWYIHGELHRDDGPAVEHGDGRKGWWLYGTNYSEQEYKEKLAELY